MNTENTDNIISEAINALRRGEVIGLPTETVYGLAADASNADAVKKIFALKGRPIDHPLIVHIADANALPQWVSAPSLLAERLAEAFWPGPLTMILARHSSVLDVVTGGQNTVGLRCPAHPLALRILHAFGGGLAAPSANRFGRISPTTAAHVREEFGEHVPLIVDGGECEIGIESTIIDLSSDTPRILRPGKIDAEQIESIIGPLDKTSISHRPRTSGMLTAHYAPRTPMLMLPYSALKKEAEEQRAFGKRVATLMLNKPLANYDSLSLPTEPNAYAHGLYAALRALDTLAANVLLLECPPKSDAWLAVHDRLQRSTAGSGLSDST